MADFRDEAGPKAELGIFLDRQARERMHPYMVKAGCREFGEFMLEALNYAQEKNGGEIFSYPLATSRDAGITLYRENGGVRAALFAVEFTFRGAAIGTVGRLMQKEAGGYPLRWLFAPIDDFVKYLDHQPKRPLSARRIAAAAPPPGTALN